METVKDLFILALLVIMFKKRVQIGHVFMVCAILFGLLHSLSPLNLLKIMGQTLIDPSTVVILVALYLITLLERIMRKSGGQSKLVNGLMGLSGDPRVSMAILPAIIGLLPSPGGARFSAPLVEEAAKNVQLPPDQNAAINYYYRHLWEYFLPLYPASLVAVQILGVRLETFVLVMLPFTPVTILSGFLLFRKFPKPSSLSPKTSNRTALKQISEGLAPIAAIMLLVLLLKMDILAALVLTIAVMFAYYKINKRQIAPMLLAAFELRLLYMVFGAIYLREVFIASGSIDLLLASFQSLGLGPLQIAIIFPMIISLLTGVTIAGVTIALPVVVSLAGANDLLSLGSLALASIVIGIMLSPMHLCLLMSIEHFAADFIKTYRRLLLPETILLAFAIAYYYILPF